MGGHCLCLAGAIPIVVEASLNVCSQWEARHRENDSSAAVIAQYIVACWLLVLQVLVVFGMRLVANKFSLSGNVRHAAASRLKSHREGMVLWKCEARPAAVTLLW